jgi:hypothetical protein
MPSGRSVVRPWSSLDRGRICGWLPGDPLVGAGWPWMGVLAGGSPESDACRGVASEGLGV